MRYAGYFEPKYVDIGGGGFYSQIWREGTYRDLSGAVLRAMVHYGGWDYTPNEATT